MHVYQMRSSIPSVVSATQERIHLCMNALRDVSKVWLVAKMVHTLFESILGNKVLEERLQKAPGKRHNKSKQTASATPTLSKKEEQPKRKYDEMDFGYTVNGPPAPQESYERSRPQTPAVTPSRDLGGQQSINNLNAPSQTSPHTRQPSDTFLSGGNNSRGNTRPTSPFNSYSIPGTPPDLYLVTRNSPPISQSLWENFQPDQLFPGGTDMNLQQFPSPGQNPVDPQLQMPQMQTPQMQQNIMSGGQQMPQTGMRGSQDSSAGMGMTPGMQGMPQMQQGGMQNQVWPMQAFDARMGSMDQSDNWSDSSRSQGPMVPAHLNVEDW